MPHDEVRLRNITANYFNHGFAYVTKLSSSTMHQPDTETWG